MTEVGRRATFTALAREQLPWLYSLARRLVGGDWAEDAVQECLMKAYRNFDGLRDHKAAPAWFRQILVNHARDQWRKDATGPDEDSLDEMPDYSLYRKIADKDPWPYSDSVHLDFLERFEAEDVWNVLDRLSDRYRAPLVLVHMEGFSTAEVAKLFDAPQGTVLSWLHRGRGHFERELWEYAKENDLLREPEGARR